MLISEFLNLIIDLVKSTLVLTSALLLFRSDILSLNIKQVLTVSLRKMFVINLKSIHTSV